MLGNIIPALHWINKVSKRSGNLLKSTKLYVYSSLIWKYYNKLGSLIIKHLFIPNLKLSVSDLKKKFFTEKQNEIIPSF